MNKFDEQLLRLKQAVQLTADQDVAALLGLSKEAFFQRKKRDAFPEDKLAALAVKRPALGIDVNFILTGTPTEEIAANARGIQGRLAQVNGPVNASLDSLKLFITEHPEIDPIWLLTGRHQKLDGELSHLEVSLVANYRAASPEGQKALVVQAAFFAKNNAGAAELAEQPKTRGEK